ncbi:MAG: YHS domain-containing (seleno)protein [Bacteroidota bacterium]
MRLFTILSFLILTCNGIAQSQPQRTEHYNIKNGLALQGYDPVAYFSAKALKGVQKYALDYQGLTYYFSSSENQQAFKNNPTKYEPQYGGWCAFAMGDRGKKVKINPKTFKITQGKLYLFYNAYFNNTLDSWNEQEAVLTNQANTNWNKIVNN